MKLKSLLILAVVAFVAAPLSADTLILRFNPVEDGVTMTEKVRGYKVNLNFNLANLEAVEAMFASPPKEAVALSLWLAQLAQYGELRVSSPGRPATAEVRRLHRLNEDGIQEEVAVLISSKEVNPVLWSAFEGLRGALLPPGGLQPLGCENDGITTPCGECPQTFHSQERWEDPCLSGGANCTICCVCAKKFDLRIGGF